MQDNLESDFDTLLGQCLYKDRHYFKSQKRNFSKQDTSRQQKLLSKMRASAEKALLRTCGIPDISWDTSLPVVQKKNEIHKLLKKSQVLIVAGETGSGKTTQLPKLCLELGRGAFGIIGHTQPRRLAAKAVAQRIAEELNVELGQQVGYQVRFNDKSSEDNLVKLMTDGILLAEIQQDPYLSRYDTIIVDEAHERSLNIDFLLGYLKRLLPKRPDLKLVVTSATIDVERFSRHFNNAPVIEVSGRMFDVKVCYRPLEDLQTESKDKDELIQAGVISVLEEIAAMESSGKGTRHGDVLIFLSGEREIRELSKRLRKEKLPHTTILPLYARLSPAEQQKIFHPSGIGRRIILATNVAETSLTVPGIHYVIDSGFARISRYSAHSKVQRLPIEPVSQASANQRKGRCGRIAAGTCFRLYPEADFLARPEFTDAEILRTSLASVILQMLSLRLGDIGQFPFIDTPEPRAINDGFLLLKELGAVSETKQLAKTGRTLARFPVDPRMGRMLIEASLTGALNEVLVIVSALSVQDPRERPSDNRQLADESHKEFAHKSSDFLSFLNLWNWFEEQREALTQGKVRALCKQRFVHYLRMREWRDMHRQLLLVCKEMALSLNKEIAGYEAIHKALLAGLVTQVGIRHDKADYQGVRNRKFWIAPGSSLYGKKPKWVMAAELVETSRLYARVAAGIEPQWIEPLIKTLAKKSHLEPHWEKKYSQVVAREQVLLYGLMVASHKVHYGPINPAEARGIFIREALVAGNFTTRLAFFHKNNKTIEKVEALEDKARKRDILVDDEDIFKFYDERIPGFVYSGATLEKWISSDRNSADKLVFSESYITQKTYGTGENACPDSMRIDGIKLPLTYVFEPGADNDGVTVTLPLPLLFSFPEERAEWLTPGLLHEKIVQLIRSLPKAIRKHFIPATHFATAIEQALTPGNESLLPRLSEKLFRMTGVKVEKAQWQTDLLEPHLKMRFHLVDDEGKVLAESRDIEELRQRFSDKAKTALENSGLNDKNGEKQGLTQWSFGPLKASTKIKKAGLMLTAYPGLVDNDESVSLALFDSEAMARAQTYYGLGRLVILRLASPLKNIVRAFTHTDKIAMLAAGKISKKQLVDTLPVAIINNVFMEDKTLWPKDQTDFERFVKNGEKQLENAGVALEKLLVDIFTRYHALMKTLKKQVSLQVAFSMSDIKAQLDNLVYARFLKETPWRWLSEYPRYLEAIETRIQKIGTQERKDQLFTQELQERGQLWREKKQALDKQNKYDERLELYRWMLEEYRVSLFAQALKTKLPVSAKRLDKLWVEICG